MCRLTLSMTIGLLIRKENDFAQHRGVALVLVGELAEKIRGTIQVRPHCLYRDGYGLTVPTRRLDAAAESFKLPFAPPVRPYGWFSGHRGQALLERLPRGGSVPAPPLVRLLAIVGDQVLVQCHLHRKRWSGRPPFHGVTMRQRDTHVVCGQGIRGASMGNVSIIGLDISKRSFQVHGATAEGAPVLRRKLTRAKVLEFFASQPRCLVVMETCGGAHHWGREIQQLGHEVRLIAPFYVKAFAKRQKSDARDAAAIVEAAQRPTMRFVVVKTKQAQARSMVYRTRGLLVRQRTQTVNAIRGHLAGVRSGRAERRCQSRATVGGVH